MQRMAGRQGDAMRWLLVVSAVAGLSLFARATLIQSQEPFPDGAFVRDRDGTGYVVANGMRHPIVWTDDGGSGLAVLREGVAVSSIGDVPSPASPPPQVRDRIPLGTLVRVASEGGESLLITALAVQDNAQSTNRFNIAKGRWVVVEWRVTNEGARDRRLFATDLKLLTAGGFVVTSGNYAGHPEPHIGTSTL